MVLRSTKLSSFFAAGIALVLFPLSSPAQKLKKNEFDNVAKQWRTETFPVNIKSSPDAKMDISLQGADTSFMVLLEGSGAGTSTLDVNTEVVFLMDDGSKVKAFSPSIQSMDHSQLPPVYRHRYKISYEGLERLTKHSIVSLRKYSVGGFDDIVIEKKNAAKAKDVSGVFFGEVTKRNPARNTASVPAGFPGGNDVLEKFVNRNLKPLTELQVGEKKEVIVQFRVTADGSPRDFQIKQPGGPALDNELLRILARMPKWKPAIQNQKQTESLITQMVRFQRTETSLQAELLSL